MAHQASQLIPSATVTAANVSDIVVALAAGVASVVIPIPKNVVFIINYQPTAASLVGMNISFGNSATSILTPTAANSYSIPPNLQTIWDMGQALNEIQLFATNAGTAFIKILSVN